MKLDIQNRNNVIDILKLLGRWINSDHEKKSHEADCLVNGLSIMYDVKQASKVDYIYQYKYERLMQFRDLTEDENKQYLNLK